jgi:hypothetical protein
VKGTGALVDGTVGSREAGGLIDGLTVGGHFVSFLLFPFIDFLDKLLL